MHAVDSRYAWGRLAASVALSTFGAVGMWGVVVIFPNLQAEFAAMGLTFVPSAANFVLVHVGDGDAVFKALLRRGLIVRAMRSYKLPGWIPVSVGTMEQNRTFIENLRALEQEGLLKKGEIVPS